jgi:ribosomal protein S18 acetylase RimI-like enzyme
MEKIQYQSLGPQHFQPLLALGNKVHGDNYLDIEQLQGIYQKSQLNNINASWVALSGEQLVGFRLTLAPGSWQVDSWCSPAQWQISASEICYFKCNTVHSEFRQHGIGSRLLQHSIHSVKAQGAKGGLAHIWLASPGNSAFLYFTKNGGQLIAKHPEKWRDTDAEDPYNCPICGVLCHCVAAEMMLYFEPC